MRGLLIFKRGAYEVPNTLTEALEDLRLDFQRDHTLRKACVRNGWTVLRPKPSSGCFVKASEEQWFQDSDLQIGAHRLRSSWAPKRFNNLDAGGNPKDVTPLTEKDKVEEGEAATRGGTGGLSELAARQAMVGSGELSKDALEAMTKEPWLAMEVNDVEGVDGLRGGQGAFQDTRAEGGGVKAR